MLKKVAIFGTEPVTGKIGGLGIRQLEIARVLSKKFEIKLITPFDIEKHKEKFEITKIKYLDKASIAPMVEWADVIVATQPHRNICSLVKEKNRKMAIDLFPIVYFEEMERLQLSGKPATEKKLHFAGMIGHLLAQLKSADFYFCASERERDYYLGILTMLGKVKPHNYNSDKHFKKLISVIPFGLPKREPKKGKNLIKGKVQGVGKKDFLIIWGGSLWNWYDCLTPVRAMARLKKTCPRAKLVFTCSTHPATGKPPEEYNRTVELAKEKGLLNKNIFFYSDWVPHNQRDYYLTEADAGITTFHDHVENYFSFRIRLMDYLWADLPIIANDGGTISELIKQKNLGEIFPFGDDAELAKRIKKMASNPATVKKMRKNIAIAKKDFHWDKVLKPLVSFLQNPTSDEPLFEQERFMISFLELNKLSLNSILFLRSSPIKHSAEAIKALKLIAPAAKIDMVVQKDMDVSELEPSINKLRMPSNQFEPDNSLATLNGNGPYDAVVCAFSNKDLDFYKNVIGFASTVKADNYLAFNDDYQFNDINILCKG